MYAYIVLKKKKLLVVDFACQPCRYRWVVMVLTLLHSERPKLHTVLAFLSAIGFNTGMTYSVCMDCVPETCNCTFSGGYNS